MRRKRVRPQGFTLLELLAVMVIVAVVLLIAIPAVDVPERRVDRAARELAYTLMGAQQRAVVKQHDVLVEFEVPAGPVVVTEDANMDGRAGEDEVSSAVDLPDGVLFGRGSATALGIGDGPVTFEAGSGGRPRLVFHRNGSASEWGGLYVKAAGAGPVRALEVTRSTGRVTWYTHAPGGWERR